MLFMLFVVLINILIIMSLNSQLSLKTNQYENHIVKNDIEKIIYQEKIILNAVNSFCKSDVEACYDLMSETSVAYIPIANLANFVADSFVLENLDNSFFKSIYLDLENKEIGVIHNITDDSLRNKYLENSLNKNQIINCLLENEVCENGIVKNIQMTQSLIEKLNIVEEAKKEEALL